MSSEELDMTFVEMIARKNGKNEMIDGGRIIKKDKDGYEGFLTTLDKMQGSEVFKKSKMTTKKNEINRGKIIASLMGLALMATIHCYGMYKVSENFSSKVEGLKTEATASGGMRYFVDGKEVDYSSLVNAAVVACGNTGNAYCTLLFDKKIVPINLPFLSTVSSVLGKYGYGILENVSDYQATETPVYQGTWTSVDEVGRDATIGDDGVIVGFGVKKR